MSTIPGMYGARRGTVILGARTQGKIQLIDGPMNSVRGNPTSNFQIYPSYPEYQQIAAAYRTMANPNAKGQSLDLAIYENVLFAPLFAYPGSWNAFNNLSKSPLPANLHHESLGFFVNTRGRYVEVPIVDLNPDLVLAMPMNE